MKAQIAIPGSDIFLMLVEEDVKNLNLDKSIECIVNYENKDYSEKIIKLIVRDKIINRQGKFIGEGYSVREYPANKFCGDVKKYNIAIDKDKFIELKEKGYIGTRRGSSRLDIRYFIRNKSLIKKIKK